MKKRRILFLGETYRADAITWMNGLREFGNFEIVTWELKTGGAGISRIKRIIEFLQIVLFFKKITKSYQADMVIAERITSYGFLASLSGSKAIAIAQQGSTDLWPLHSVLTPIKKVLEYYAFKKANIIHAWGPIMAKHMQNSKVDMQKVLILPKGINLTQFEFKNNTDDNKIQAIVTRSLKPEYKHDIIIKAFAILKQKNIPFQLTIVGGGSLLNTLKKLTKDLNLEQEILFTEVIPNSTLPKLLQNANIYISMPVTEGVSASLFEAMASGCYPVVTDIPGNQSWINQKENGILVESENIHALASEIEWAFLNKETRNKSVMANRKFVEENANYAVNMQLIATKYHLLIDSISK